MPERARSFDDFMPERARASCKALSSEISWRYTSHYLHCYLAEGGAFHRKAACAMNKIHMRGGALPNTFDTSDYATALRGQQS